MRVIERSYEKLIFLGHIKIFVLTLLSIGKSIYY